MSPSPSASGGRPRSPRARCQNRSARPARSASGAARAGLAHRDPPHSSPSPASVSKIVIVAGPRMTTNSAGKMKSTSGNTSLMAVLAAASSARCRRLVRSEVGLHPKGLRHRGAEAVGLDQHGDQRAHLRHAGAIGQPAQRLFPAGAGPDLEVDHHELLAEHRAHPVDFLGHPDQRLVEAESGLDADHQHVERVGKRALDLRLPLLDPAADVERRHDPADARRPRCARRPPPARRRPAAAPGRR